MVVNNTRAYISAFILGTFFLSMFPLGIAFPSREGPSPGEHESNDIEMGFRQSGIGSSWPAADQDLKHRFEQAYLSAPDPRTVFQEYFDTLGARAMLDYLELRNQRCHGEAHDLGGAIFDHVKDIGLALQTCGNRCTNACMHGVVSEAFGNREYEEVIKQMPGFCEGGEMAALHKPGNCAHGIGHALMILTGHDIDKSLAGCSAFPTVGMDYYCATGVFMEYRGMLVDAEEASEPVTRLSLHFPCDTYTQFPAACYRYMLRQIADELNADSGRLIEECLRLEGGLEQGCFHGLGAMYSRTVANHPSLLPGLCLGGVHDDQIMCIEGVIEKMADFDEERAMAVCAVLNGEQAEVCMAGARGKMYRLNKPTMKLYRGVGP